MVSSNCDHVKFSVLNGGEWKPYAEADPDRAQFPHLKYPPFSVSLPTSYRSGWGDLKIDGYIKGKLAISKTLSGSGADQKFELRPDDTELLADGADTSRMVLRVTDQYGAIRPYANDPIILKLEGPGRIIGDNPFGLVGGTGAVWLRAGESAGTLTLTATHPRLGSQTVTVTLKAVPPEGA